MNAKNQGRASLNEAIANMAGEAPPDLPAPPAHLVAAAPTRPAGQRETAAEAALRIRTEREAGKRPQHLGGFTRKLEIHGEVPGFKLAIINDDRNRVAECEAHGWAMVRADEIEGVNANVTSYNNDPGGQVRFLVGSKEGGEPMYAYLMKLPQEIWDDDEAVKLAYNRRNDAILRGGGVPNENAADREQRYVPKDVPISISR